MGYRLLSEHLLPALLVEAPKQPWAFPGDSAPLDIESLVDGGRELDEDERHHLSR